MKLSLETQEYMFGGKMQENNKETEIDLLQIAGILLDKIVVLLAAGAITALVVFIISVFVIAPKYKSQTQLYIINRQNDGVTTYNDIQSSTQLVNDYKVLVTSYPVLEKVISNLKLDMTTEELEDMLTVGIETDSRVLEITVTSTDPYLSKNIADAVADISAEQITRIMQIEKVNVIQYGQVADRASSPNVILNTVVGFAAGVVLISIWLIASFMIDDSVKSSEDIEKYIGISTLALIPYSEDSDSSPDKKKRKKWAW